MNCLAREAGHSCLPVPAAIARPIHTSRSARLCSDDGLRMGLRANSVVFKTEELRDADIRKIQSSSDGMDAADVYIRWADKKLEQLYDPRKVRRHILYLDNCSAHDMKNVPGMQAFMEKWGIIIIPFLKNTTPYFQPLDVSLIKHMKKEQRRYLREILQARVAKGDKDVRISLADLEMSITKSIGVCGSVMISRSFADLGLSPTYTNRKVTEAALRVR